MIADPRADALLQNFAGQWLHVRNLQNAAPNTDEFPDFDNDLRDGCAAKSRCFSVPCCARTVRFSTC